MQSATLRPHATSGFLGRSVDVLRGRDLPIIAACAIVACAACCLFCLVQGIAGPLWLDESGTGALASEPSLAALTAQARNDPNAPLYYYVIWFWARLFGVSNLALRLPSVIFTLSAPVVAWAGLHRSRPMLACVWAALLALWLTGIFQSGYARCYALLLFLSVASAVAAIRAYDAPTPRRAFGWAVAACLMTLTHYFAGPLAFLQGLVLLVRYRGRWRGAWPATLVFLPAFAWIGWHASRLVTYARPDIAWYSLLKLTDLPDVLSIFLGPSLSIAAPFAALAVSRLLALRGEAPVARRNSWDRSVIATALTSIAIAGFWLIVAALRPTFTLRYLTPFVPGVLLLVAAGVVAASRNRWQPLAVLILTSLIGTALGVASEDAGADKIFTFEPASAWIAGSHPARLAFFWDGPFNQAIAPRELQAIGGFFFRRPSPGLEVEPVLAKRGTDMNDAVLAAAGPSGAVLWLYDTTLHDTTAILHPPHLDGTNGLECRNFGISNAGVVACRRRP